MTQTKLAILVILSGCVDMTLGADKEAEVKATRNSLDLNLIAKWHPDWIADFLSLSGKRPCK